tara:strand:+ start:4594 stop:4704 length:111 start_codon:yes stop_codon:yes gene_type:complete
MYVEVVDLYLNLRVKFPVPGMPEGAVKVGEIHALSP